MRTPDSPDSGERDATLSPPEEDTAPASGSMGDGGAEPTYSMAVSDPQLSTGAALRAAVDGTELETQPIETQPIETQPIEAQPVATQPVESPTDQAGASYEAWNGTSYEAAGVSGSYDTGSDSPADSFATAPGGASVEADDAVTDPLASAGSDGRPPRMSRRTLIALLSVLGFAILCFGFWFAGERNSRNFFLRCGDTQITAAQGRSFPPWGESRLGGGKWAPIVNVLTLNQCDDESFDSRAALEERYRDVLVSQADTWLAQLGPDDARDLLPTILDQLQQAELLSRSSDDASKVARDRIGRLLGDVAYWRAYDDLAVAREHLRQAAERLRGAADDKPVHVRDASEWRKFVLFTERELSAGPPTLRPAPEVSSEPTDTPAATPTDGATSGDTPVDLKTPVAAPAATADVPEESGATPPSRIDPPPPSSGTLL